MAQILKKGNGYMVRVTYRDATGKQHKKSKAGFKTKTQARAYGAKMDEQKYGGVISTKNPYFADYYDDWYTAFKKNKVSKSTQNFYNYVINVVKKHFPRKRIGDISRHQYQIFINSFGAGHSKETVSKVNSGIKACLKEAVFEGVIPRNFAENIELVWNEEKTRKVEYLSIKELNTLTEYVKKNLRPAFPARYMILTIIYTGMRLSEIAGLTWDDINFNFKTISITKTWNYRVKNPAPDERFGPTKTPSSVRTIHASQELLDALAQLKGNDDEMVFLNPTYKTMTESTSVNRTLRSMMEHCDLHKKNFHFYSLRHAHVAYLLAHDVPLYAISKRLGHANMTITANTYAYLIDELRARSDTQIDEALSQLGVPKGVPTSKLSKANNN